MAFLLRVVSLAFVVAVAGCVPVDLSQLNTRYDVLMQRKAALKAPDASTFDGSYEREKEEVDAGFKALATEASKVSGEADQYATRIVALRLAAVAAWQGNDTATYTTAQDAGVKLCSASPPRGTIGAPRDCAILAYLPIVRAYEQKAVSSNALVERESQNDMTVLPEASALLPKLSALRESQLLLNNQPLLTAIVKGQGQYDGISPTTKDYFRRIALATACLALTHFRNGSAMRPDTPEKLAFAGSARTVAQSYADVLFAAELLSTADPNWISLKNSDPAWLMQPGGCPKNVKP